MVLAVSKLNSANLAVLIVILTITNDVVKNERVGRLTSDGSFVFFIYVSMESATE
jgi:hypothetical protein